jgi:hypothetical protein
MASLRNLKKEIDELMSIVLSDCLFVLDYNEKVDKEQVSGIAGRVIQLHHEFRNRANNPDGKDNPKLAKKYFSTLKTELFKKADEMLEELSLAVEKTR